MVCNMQRSTSNPEDIFRNMQKSESYITRDLPAHRHSQTAKMPSQPDLRPDQYKNRIEWSMGIPKEVPLVLSFNLCWWTSSIISGSL